MSKEVRTPEIERFIAGKIPPHVYIEQFAGYLYKIEAGWQLPGNTFALPAIVFRDDGYCWRFYYDWDGPEWSRISLDTFASDYGIPTIMVLDKFLTYEEMLEGLYNMMEEIY